MNNPTTIDLKTDRAALIAAMREVIEDADGDGLILTEADASDRLAELIMQRLEDFEPVAPAADLIEEAEPEPSNWYFSYNGAGGIEEFGPYDTEADARSGMQRVSNSALDHGDAPKDTDFTGPYQESRED